MNIVLRNNQYAQGEGKSLFLPQGWLNQGMNHPTGCQRRRNHLCLMLQHPLFIKKLDITHHIQGEKTVISESMQ